MMNDNNNDRAVPPLSPKLSICLITYNRSVYLARTLDHLLSVQWPFPCEIIVHDNCSTDDTAAVVERYRQHHPQLRYIHQQHNVGAENNLMAAYRQVSGEYAIYLADDDQLVPEAVQTVIAYLDQHPSVGVCHCPWELWDAVNQTREVLFYQVDSERIFSRKEAFDLCNFILNQRVFPEICVYRTSVLQKMMYMPHKAYWAFVHLINALNESDVAFLPVPYYRSVTRHWPGETRQQAGHQQAMADWDLYRGGIEYMLHRAFTYMGLPGVPPEQLDAVQKAVQVFVLDRMLVALRLLIKKKDYISANDLVVRLHANRALPANEIEIYRNFLVGRAAVQAALAILSASTCLKSLALYEVAAPDAVRSLVEDVSEEIEVAVLPSDCPQLDGWEQMLVLTGNAQAKQRLIAAGFKAGFILVETELTRQFMV